MLADAFSEKTLTLFFVIDSMNAYGSDVGRH